ncbi:hypothetical protein ACTQ54_01495 [Fundicoccus sp. Sow4_H7]|uniref:hypothetical protein n=1 Tax=Fundicoccus sp. Sow4_H7 TaxID=3438784 RepID=UPI003F905E4E
MDILKTSLLNKYPQSRFYFHLENIAAFGSFKKRLVENNSAGILRYQRKVADEDQRYLFVEDSVLFERLFGEIVAVDVKKRELAGIGYWIVLVRFANRTIAHLEFCVGSEVALQMEWNGVHQLLSFDSELQLGLKYTGGQNDSLEVLPELLQESSYSAVEITDDYEKWQRYLFGEGV